MPWYDTRAKKWRFRKSGGGTGSSPSKSLAKLAAAASKDRAFKVKHGLLPATSARHAEMEKVDLVEHLAAYMKHQRNKGRDPKYIRTVELRLPKLFALGRFRRFADITSTSIAAALAAYADSGVSQQTVRHGLSQTKWFLNWCVEDGRIPSNPIAGAKAPPVTEQKYRRRAATPEEIVKIVEAAGRKESTHWKPQDRAMLIAIFLGAGFRKGDCIKLTPESFKLAGDNPTITVEASSSKNRKAVVQPISAAFAAQLQEWMKGKRAGRRVFPSLTPKSRIAEMVRKCCKKAGVPFETRDGRLDGHAMRHTYGTMLGQSGNDIKTVQELMRHASITTTQKYMHTTDARKRSAVEGLKNWGA
jgi:integrase